MSRLTFDIAERVLWTAAQAYAAAVVVLPGGIWSSANWKVAAGAALISLVKGFAASRLTGDPGTAATLPASVTATAQVAGEVVGTVVGETGQVLGEVVGTVTGVIDPLVPDKDDEHGGIGTGVAVFVVVVLLAFGACLAIADDDDEENSMSPPAWVMDRDEDNDPRHDCYKAEAPCSDDDFSPSFDKSPVEDSFIVTICVVPDSCHFEGEPE
jgi:hypothetical protein